MKKDLFFIQISIVKKAKNLKIIKKASMCFHWKSLEGKLE